MENHSRSGICFLPKQDQVCFFSLQNSTAGWYRHLMARAALGWGCRGILLLYTVGFYLVMSAMYIGTGVRETWNLEFCFVLLLVRENFKAIKLVKKSRSVYYLLITSLLLYLTTALSFWSIIGAWRAGSFIVRRGKKNLLLRSVQQSGGIPQAGTLLDHFSHSWGSALRTWAVKSWCPLNFLGRP